MIENIWLFFLKAASSEACLQLFFQYFNAFFTTFFQILNKCIAFIPFLFVILRKFNQNKS